MSLGKEVSALLQSAQMQAATLTAEQADELRHRVVQNFTTMHRPWRFGIWEDLTQSYAVQQARSYLWLAEFLNNEASVLLFNPGDEPAMYSFVNGADIAQVIDDLPHAEFYVTN